MCAVPEDEALALSTGISRYFVLWRTCAVSRGAIVNRRICPFASMAPGSSAASLSRRSRNNSAPVHRRWSAHGEQGRCFLFIGLSRDQRDRVSNRPDSGVERRNAVGDDDVPGQFGIDQLRVRNIRQEIVGLVEQDLVGQPGPTSERDEDGQKRPNIADLVALGSLRQIDDDARVGMLKGSGELARIGWRIVPAKRDDVGQRR